MPASLFIEQGPRNGTRYALDEGVVVVGRDPESSLHIPDPFLSRRQFRIASSGGDHLLENLAARSVTLLNGIEEPAAVTLEDDDLIQAGATRIRFRVEDVTRDDDGASATILGASWQTERLRELVRQAGATTLPVLLVGERGAGKGLVARAIHRARSRAPLMIVRCAVSQAFEPAASLYLEDVDQLTAEGQAKLLALLDTDARVIAGTARDLNELAFAGTYRLDLATRLSAFHIEVTPLCARKDDIAALASAMLARYAPNALFTRDALDKLRAHVWPGNVSELRAVIQRAVIFHPVPELDASAIKVDRTPSGELEREHVQRALAVARGKSRSAAAALAISRSSLADYLTRYDLA